MLLYKSFRRERGRLFSWYDDWKDDRNEWRLGEWRKLEGKIELCKNGFHACTSIEKVRSFTLYGTIAQVEVRGKSDRGLNQEAWSEMRIKKIIP